MTDTYFALSPSNFASPLQGLFTAKILCIFSVSLVFSQPGPCTFQYGTMFDEMEGSRTHSSKSCRQSWVQEVLRLEHQHSLEAKPIYCAGNLHKTGCILAWKWLLAEMSSACCPQNKLVHLLVRICLIRTTQPCSFSEGFYLFLRGTRYVYLSFMFVNIYRYVSTACI